MSSDVTPPEAGAGAPGDARHGPAPEAADDAAVTQAATRLAEDLNRSSTQEQLLREQNELLRDLVARQRAYRPILHTALGAFAGFAILWSIAQTDWGAENVAVPVKFFVSGSQAESLDDAQEEIRESLEQAPGESTDLYEADELCLGSDDPSAPDYDPDC